jgi:hypothetical protein
MLTLLIYIANAITFTIRLHNLFNYNIFNSLLQYLEFVIAIATNQYLESPSPLQVLALLFISISLHDLHEVIEPHHSGPPGCRHPAPARPPGYRHRHPWTHQDQIRSACSSSSVNVQIRSACAESNPIDIKNPTMSRTEDHPTWASHHLPYPFLPLILHRSRRCRRCSIDVSHLTGHGWTADRSLATRMKTVRSDDDFHRWWRPWLRRWRGQGQG